MLGGSIIMIVVTGDAVSACLAPCRRGVRHWEMQNNDRCDCCACCLLAYFVPY